MDRTLKFAPFLCTMYFYDTSKDTTMQKTPQITRYTTLQLYKKPILFSCRTVGDSCDSAQQKIIDQMIIWSTPICETPPDATEPSGEKCLYEVRNFNLKAYLKIHFLKDILIIDMIDMIFKIKDDILSKA